jgi:hypothetical protein
VFVLGRIATTDVAAAQAQTKMHPRIAHLQTFFTTLRMRFDILNLIEMRACRHRCPPMGRVGLDKILTYTTSAHDQPKPMARL